MIAVGRRLATDSVDVVRAADDQGVAQAVNYLVGRGHRAIAYVDDGKGVIPGDRRSGYRTAMLQQLLGTTTAHWLGWHTST